MKKNIFSSLSQQLFKTAVCLTIFSGSVAVYAQTDETPDESVQTVKMRPKKQEPVYEMRTVTGTVVDGATKAPMGGVKIQALGNSRYSALTEEDGTFTLDVPAFVSVLYVYAPEYLPLHEAVKKDGALNIMMISDKFNAFYGETNEVVSKSSFNVVNSSSINIETDIQNHLGGDVRTIAHNAMPGMGAFMNIHGINSLNASTQPLVVLDGNIVDTQLGRESLHEGFYHNILAGLDPETIESVEVLKNGTALYGAKGGNGVIIIKTKRGKSMATKINVNIFGGAELAPKTLPMMNGEQYRSYLTDLLATSNKFAGLKNNSGTASLTAKFAFLNPNPGYKDYAIFHNDLDWSDGLYRTAWTQNYKVNVEGGDERGMYALQLGYTMSDATAKGNDFDRLSLRFNTDINVFANLYAGIDISYNQTSYNVLDQGWSSNYDLQNIGAPNVLGLVQTPFLNKYAYARNMKTGELTLTHDLAGKYAHKNDNLNNALLNPFGFTRQLTDNFSLRNPFWIVANGNGKNKNYAELSQMGINFAPRWEVNKHLTISDRFNYAMYRTSERYFLPSNGATPYTLTDLGDIHSVLKSLFSKETVLNNDARIDWKNTYGAHDIHVFGGWRYNNFSYSNTTIRGYNNSNDKLPVINATMQFVNYDGTKDNWVDMTWYASAQYNYAHRYYVDLAASAMSSSRFGNNTKQGFNLCGVSWGFFPSVQLGWVISNEKWFPTGKGVNYLKLTGGFDMSGNDEIDYYAARTYWASKLLSSTTVGLVLENIANSNIQWETTYRWNVGLEGSFLNNRLQAGIDLYWNRTTNLLMRTAPHYLTGLPTGWTNDGELTNKGFDFHANIALVDTRNFKWQLGATIGHYNNKITHLPASYQFKAGDRTINGFTNSIYGDNNILTAVGESVGSFYGYKTNGIFTSQAEADEANLRYDTGNSTVRYFKAGDVRFVDQNGDGMISDADKVVIGNPNPDIYGNISTSFMYKRLRLDVLFKYSLGNDVYNYQRSQLEAGSNLYNQTVAVASRWSHEGQQAKLPRAVYTDSEEWVNNERFSDRWIEDGSYLKLKNVRLTYTCPWNTTWLQGMKIWAEANNLVTITKYLGADPETSCSNSTLYQGIDNGTVMLGRSFNVGLSINF